MMLNVKPLEAKRAQLRCLPTTRSHVCGRAIVHAMHVVCSSQGPTRCGTILLKSKIAIILLFIILPAHTLFIFLFRKLIIMRHADSEDPKQLPGVRDHDRPITSSGKDAAKDVSISPYLLMPVIPFLTRITDLHLFTIKSHLLQIADQIKAAGWLPDVFICSNAVRSRETFEAIRDHHPETDYADIHFLGSLYTISQLDGQTRGHLQEIVVAEATARHNCVLCLGHNKGWEEAASSFAGETLKLGNCYAALLEGYGKDWREAFEENARWKLVSLLRPKE